MDTIETTEPVGVEGATSSQDTSATDTQPVESTDTASDGEVVEAGEASETLLAGKYKSAEELEKAYGELQKKFGEVGQKAEIANLLEKQTGMTAQQIRDYIAQQEQAQLEQKIANDPTGYALQEVQALKAQLAMQQEKAELDKFISKNPEYEPFKEKILNLGLNLERDKSYEQIATEYFGQARAQGQQDAYKKIEKKENTRVTGVSQAPPRQRITPEDMDRMSAAELEAILPHADITNRPY